MTDADPILAELVRIRTAIERQKPVTASTVSSGVLRGALGIFALVLLLIFAWNVLDVFVPAEELRDAAMTLAEELAGAAPLGLMATRATSRLGLVEKLKVAMDREKALQGELYLTDDFQEGIAATSARRKPEFKGR